MYIITIRTQNDAIRESILSLIQAYYDEYTYANTSKPYVQRLLVTNPFDLIDRVNPNNPKYPINGITCQVIYFIPSKPEMNLNAYETENWVKMLPMLNGNITKSCSVYVYNTCSTGGSINSGCNETLDLRKCPSWVEFINEHDKYLNLE